MGASLGQTQRMSDEGHLCNSGLSAEADLAFQVRAECLWDIPVVEHFAPVLQGDVGEDPIQIRIKVVEFRLQRASTCRISQLSLCNVHRFLMGPSCYSSLTFLHQSGKHNCSF